MMPLSVINGSTYLKKGPVFGSSTIDLSTHDSSIIFALQLLIASHKQFKGGFWGAEPSSFST